MEAMQLSLAEWIGVGCLSLAERIGVGCLCHRYTQQCVGVSHPSGHHGEPADHAEGGKETGAGSLVHQFSMGRCAHAQFMKSYQILPLQAR